MSKIEETEHSKINDENQKTTFSLLLPYYTSDKWTNKLKRKIKTLANAYNSYYQRIQQENNQFYKDKYNPNINNIQRKSKSFMNHKFIGNQNIFNRTSTGFMNYQTNSNFMNTNENINYNRRKLLNEILPPVTNYNPNYDPYVYDGVTYLSDTGEPYASYFYPKESNIFCISAQQKNQNTTMNKFYNSHKNKDNFFYGNHKNSTNTKNLFSSKGHNEEFNKFIYNCKSKDRINFFKKNDYNPQIKMVQPKDRRQISALKDLRKKQYLDYIKSKSEDNYMKFYYNP
jgi:hypothetical protein